MGIHEEFDDRQNQRDAENEKYMPYEYQETNNDSWAGALPVKQYGTRGSFQYESR